MCSVLFRQTGVFKERLRHERSLVEVLNILSASKYNNRNLKSYLPYCSQTVNIHSVQGLSLKADVAAELFKKYPIVMKLEYSLPYSEKPPLDHILSKMNPVHSTFLHFSRVLWYPFSYYLGLSRSLIPGSFPTKMLYAFRIASHYTCHLNLISQVILHTGYTLRSSSLSRVIFSSAGPNISKTSSELPFLRSVIWPTSILTERF